MLVVCAGSSKYEAFVHAVCISVGEEVRASRCGWLMIVVMEMLGLG